MMKQFVQCVTCVAALMSAPVVSMAQTQNTYAENQITFQGTVEAIDYQFRTVTVRGPEGNLVALDVPSSATRFSEIKIGDHITATYSDRISLRMKPAGEPSVDRVVEPTTTAAPGAVPGGIQSRQRVSTVTVTAWSPADKIVSFRDVHGLVYSRRLLDTTEPAILTALKVGDRVDVTRTEALTVTVQREAAQAQEETLLHRLTFAVQFGVDNQFSGKMIKQSTGSTVTGVPISLDETTYDEVYGRMAMFKVGASYRTTPRTEAVFNFVWSSSDADDAATRIGTAGTVPLDVHFTGYKYWGLEGGQRWFFARKRFTPFAGYLVGINRHQDIRGTFVNVPANVTPGLAEQDGKFFEKSWAFSLGPTGGFLIGVGPIEVMAEAQIRFLGGLSDVDWLVEEGLRDINSDSSRWSLPLLVGARYRF
jgi:hypothetical protein